MSKLLTEISRIRELMGIKSEVLKESLSSSGRQRLQELLISLLKLSDNDATAFFKNLTEEDQNLLRTLINSSDGKIAGNLSDAVTIASLRNFLKNGGTDAIKSVLAKAEILLAKELSEKSAKIGYNLINTSADVQKFLKTRKQSTGGNSTILDTLSNIEKNGGVEKSTIYDRNPEMWGVLFSDLENLKLTYPNKTDGVYDYLEKISNDILKMTDPEEHLVKIKKLESDFANKIDNNVVDEIKIIVNPKPDISDKLKVLVNSDQSIRQGEYLDITKDIANQTELKKLMGDNPQNFISSIDKIEDLEAIWLITQHADNDLEFQKSMFNLLETNKENFINKFPDQKLKIKKGMAMLEDRISVNKTGDLDFSEISSGVQKYGSQGGVTPNGNYWIPRPIEMDGKLYFFETPQKLLDDSEFLKKLNTKRSEMGLSTMEEYLSMMNKNLPGESRSLEDLGDVVTDNYLYLKSQKKLGKFQQQRVDDVEKYLRGEEVDLNDNVFRTETSLENLNKSIGDYLQTKSGGYNGREYSKIIQDTLSELEDGVNVKTVVSNTNNTFPNGITDDIKKVIESVPELKNFFKNLDNGKYKYVTENEEWLPINMLNTNSGDRKTFFRDVLQDRLNEGNYRIKNINDIKLLDEKEIEKLFKDTMDYMKNNKTKMKEKISKNIKRYTKNSIVNTKRGDFGEDLIAKKFEDLGYSVLWRGDKGNALDKAGVDMIVKSPNGKVDVVSVKAISEDSYNNFFKNGVSNITGNEVIEFRSPGISLNSGLAAVVDSKNNIIIFPPQGRLDKITNQINYNEPMFRTKPGPTTVEKNTLIYNGIK